MGIAHNDISLSNLLCAERNGHIVGILNDFDLAGFMKPGVRNPEKRGWERTGSIAFMSMDLLKNPDGKQKRWYRHDLESFVWCLLWVMMDKPPLSWLDDGFEEVWGSKSLFCRDISRQVSRIQNEWTFAKQFIVKWMVSLAEASLIRIRFETSNLIEGDQVNETSAIELGNVKDEQSKDVEHILLIIKFAKLMGCYKDTTALCETSWIEVELENLEE